MSSTWVRAVDALGRVWTPRPLAAREAALAYPLLLAAGGAAEPLPAWRARVEGWLRRRRGEAEARGIMTLRTDAGVIAGLFFHASPADGTAAAPAVLAVPLLRAVEPLGAWHGLAATLRAAEAVAVDRGCAGVLLRAGGEGGGAVWSHVAPGLERLSGTAGYVRRGRDWYRPVPAGAPAWPIAAAEAADVPG